MKKNIQIFKNPRTVASLVDILGGIETVAHERELHVESVKRWIRGTVPINKKHFNYIGKKLGLTRPEVIALVSKLR